MLNKEQLNAVSHTEGPVIILAGPGTGKTRTLSYKIAYLIKEKNISPDNILAVTFTRSAANEIRERLKILLKDLIPEKEIKNMTIGTFHSIAFEILETEKYPFGSSFRIIEEEEKKRLLKDIVLPKEITGLLEEIRRSKQKLFLPEITCAREYQKKLVERNLVDFEDLFIYVLQLFKEKYEILNKYKNQFKYILVDEFQDTGFAQYEFMKVLANENICVIGDPDQSIYGFINNFFAPFEQFKKDFPNARIIRLKENYRSQNNIINAAKQVIDKNKSLFPRCLESCIEAGLPIEIIPCRSERHEAELVVRKIESLLGGSSYFAIDSNRSGSVKENAIYSLKDIAILYRFHAQSKILEKALEKAGLPYETFGKEVEEISGEGEFRDFVTNDKSVPLPIEYRGEKISLLTLHRAKGLEFPVVFITGLEEGVLPCCDAGLDEERRLFYVGITRAKNRLILCHSLKRFLFGKNLAAGPSRFLKDIHDTLKMLQNIKIPLKKKKPIQQNLF